MGWEGLELSEERGMLIADDGFGWERKVWGIVVVAKKDDYNIINERAQ